MVALHWDGPGSIGFLAPNKGLTRQDAVGNIDWSSIRSRLWNRPGIVEKQGRLETTGAECKGADMTEQPAEKTTAPHQPDTNRPYLRQLLKWMGIGFLLGALIQSLLEQLPYPYNLGLSRFHPPLLGP